MKIVVNARPLMSPLSGVGQYVFQLYSEIIRLNYTCHSYYGHAWADGLCVEPSISGRLIEYFSRKSWLSNKVMGLVRRGVFTLSSYHENASLYHEPNFLPYPSILPLVITIHDLSPLRFPETHNPEWVRIFERRLPAAVDNARAILVVSDFVRDEVLEFFPGCSDKLTTTLLGVRNNFKSLPDYKCRSELDHFGLDYGRYILVVGTLEPRKNLLTALRAYASLPSGLRTRFTLVFAGMKGWLNKQFESEIGPLVNNGQVRMLGFVPDASLNALYSGARTLLYPSLYEGFGLPPLEAMACGVPVITSNRGSLPEVVGDVGIQVEALDVVALRNALMEVLEDDGLCSRLAYLGVERAAGFTWRSTAEKTLDVFDKVLHSS